MATLVRRRWTIEVCATCDRLAVWPFCVHRPDRYPYGRWTETVTVTGPARKARRP